MWHHGYQPNACNVLACIVSEAPSLVGTSVEGGVCDGTTATCCCWSKRSSSEQDFIKMSANLQAERDVRNHKWDFDGSSWVCKSGNGPVPTDVKLSQQPSSSCTTTQPWCFLQYSIDSCLRRPTSTAPGYHQQSTIHKLQARKHWITRQPILLPTCNELIWHGVMSSAWIVGPPSTSQFHF